MRVVLLDFPEMFFSVACRELERVGGHRIFDLGLGDDDKNIQEVNFVSASFRLQKLSCAECLRVGLCDDDKMGSLCVRLISHR